MSKNVLGTSLLADFSRLLADLFEKIAGPEGRDWLEGFKGFLRHSILLKLVATISASAHQRFVMKDHLQSANIGWIGDNFKRVMLEKIEENVPAGEIKIHELVKNSLDPEIMAEIGPEKRIVFLAHFIERLEKQSKGQVGEFKTDGSANVAYIIGTDGNFWAVCAPAGASSAAAGLLGPTLLAFRASGVLVTGFSLASSFGSWIFGPLGLGSNSPAEISAGLFNF